MAMMESPESLPLTIRSWLEKQAQRLGQELVAARIDVEPDCRIFYWTTQAAERGGRESKHLLAGNGPIILDEEGQLWMTGTTYPVETFLADFRGDRRMVRPLT
jgi:hypothetical protein